MTHHKILMSSRLLSASGANEQPLPGKSADGQWFNDFAAQTLREYAEEFSARGGIAFVRAQHAGLSDVEIAEQLCGRAARAVAVPGIKSVGGFGIAIGKVLLFGDAGAPALSAASAASAAVGAAKESFGEQAYVAFVQLKLYYDLSQLYGYAIANTEDVLRVFGLAYGIEAPSTTPTTSSTEAFIRVLSDNDVVIRKVASNLLGSRLGKSIAKKALSFNPILNAGVSATVFLASTAWKYQSTVEFARCARYELSARARLRDALLKISAAFSLLDANANHQLLVLEALQRVATADGSFADREMELFRDVLQYLGPSIDVRRSLEARLSEPLSSTTLGLAALQTPALSAALIEALSILAVADGEVGEPEVLVLSCFVKALGQSLDITALRERAETFVPPVSNAQMARRTLIDASVSAGRSASEAAVSIGRAAAGMGILVRDASTSAGRVAGDAATSLGKAATGLGSSVFKLLKKKNTSSTSTDPLDRTEVVGAETLAASPLTSVASPLDGETVDAEEARVQSIMNRLIRLANMHAAKLLSDEELKLQRARLLAEL